MDIYRAEKIAQDRMAEATGDDWNKNFVAFLPNGCMISCKWLDPYFGLFQIDGMDGAATSRSLPPETDVIIGDA